MYSKVNYTIVGLFVVIFSIGMAWFAFWLAKYGLQEEYHTYKIEMKDSIAGLSKDSSVKLHGVDIGRVSQIRIDPNDIEKIDIFLDIAKDVTIKEDMFASTQMLGVTGLLSIEIHGGSNEAKTLMPTDTYVPIIKSKPSLLSKLSNNLGGLSEKLNNLLSRSESLLSDENLKNISKILDNVEKLSARGESVELKALESMREIDRTLEEFRISMKSVNENFLEATKDFKFMQKDFAEIKDVTVPMVLSLEKTSKNFNRTTLKFEKSLNRGDYNFKKILEPMLIDIQILSNQLNTMARDLSQSPSELFFKSRESKRGPGE